MHEVNRRQKDSKSKAGNTVETRKLTEGIQTTEGRKELLKTVKRKRQTEIRRQAENRTKTDKQNTTKGRQTAEVRRKSRRMNSRVQ